ncbi:MAG: 2-hydroxymuconate tautomerase [Dehalococcoidia bacterium]|nr:2-hydroxymuconate tautomerase [Dehalococcoidia bacterium]
MPLVTVEALEGRSVQQKRDLVKAITDAVVNVYGVPRDAVRVVLRNNAKEDIAWGGILFCDK